MQQRLSACPDIDSVLSIANEAGYAISKAEMLKAQVLGSNASSELSDQELAAVAGGTWTGGGPSNDVVVGVGLVGWTGMLGVALVK